MNLGLTSQANRNRFSIVRDKLHNSFICESSELATSDFIAFFPLQCKVNNQFSRISFLFFSFLLSVHSISPLMSIVVNIRSFSFRGTNFTKAHDKFRERCYQKITKKNNLNLEKKIGNVLSKQYIIGVRSTTSLEIQKKSRVEKKNNNK